MVSTTVEKLSPTRVKLSITVTPEELKPSITHAYEHIAESVNIPGFRKGKVPPPIIDQRVGRAEVLNHAVSDGLDKFYREAADTEKLRALGRPEADVTQWPNETDFTGDLQFTVEVDVRPDFTLPKYDSLKLEVDPVTVTPDEVENELENLRTRFGTLVTVDRPAKTGDFVNLDLVATIGDEEVDTASNISYELGSGELIDGIDDALDTLTAGESTTFEAPLLGGDHEGENAQIAVTVLSVKERELPSADDDFAQIASQFDTIGELRADLREQLGKSKQFGQGVQARDKIVDELLEEGRDPGPAEADRRRGAPPPRGREPSRGRHAPRRGRRVEREDLPLADPARLDRRGRGDQGRPERAHLLPRAGVRPVRHGAGRVHPGAAAEQPAAGHDRRGRPLEGARLRAQQGEGRRHHGQGRGCQRVHRVGPRRRRRQLRCQRPGPRGHGRPRHRRRRQGRARPQARATSTTGTTTSSVSPP